jgi:hypothetical protein
VKVSLIVAIIFATGNSVLAQDEGGLELQSATHNNVGIELPPTLPPPDSQIQTEFQGIQPVPEPSPLVLIGLALGFFAFANKKVRKRI